jgi:aminoglycoside/choline kinase family phosphotransferase
MTSTLPADLADFTPAWMTDALAPAYPGVAVAAVEPIARAAVTNLHLKLRIRYDEQAGAPDSVFAKLPPPDAAHRAAIGADTMGRREVRFYTDVAPTLSMRVPDCSFAGAADDGSFVLLLEDLGAVGARMPDMSWAVPADLAGSALDELAEMHVRFEDAALRESLVPWASEQRPDSSTFTVPAMRYVLDTYHDILSPEYRAVGELFITHHHELEQLWDRGPRTLLHGDPHAGNVFIDGERVGFLDWGLANVGAAMRDVSYFLTVGVETDGPGEQRALLQRYLDVRQALGGSELTFDEAWMQHRLLGGYTVVATFLGLVPPYDTPEVRPFATAFRERSMAALAVLDTVPALREALGA